MKRKVLLFSLCLLACLANSYAEKATSIDTVSYTHLTLPTT